MTFESDFHDNEAPIIGSIIAFLQDRLNEDDTVEWALKLGSNSRLQRLAVRRLLYLSGDKLSEPHLTAWRLIEESWAGSRSVRTNSIPYEIQRRLRSGERSGALIKTISVLVSPQISVEPLGEWRKQLVRKRRATTYQQLLVARLTSGELLDLGAIDLGKIAESAFLIELASELDAAVFKGLNIARRLGWDGARQLLRFGMINRVYYTQSQVRSAEETEPDAYSRGLAPSVKLLFEVVTRLSQVDLEAAAAFVRRWKSESLIHDRLWAAAARNQELATTGEIYSFLTSLPPKLFWDTNLFPEIAEMRAKRFSGLGENERQTILEKILRGPPSSFWPRSAGRDEVDKARRYWIARELRRIEAAESVLNTESRLALDNLLEEFPELRDASVSVDFPEAFRTSWRRPKPDNKFDSLSGVARLKALETALSYARASRDEDPAERANDWMMQGRNALLVLDDLEKSDEKEGRFARVWERFGYAHDPQRYSGENVETLQKNVDRVGQLIARLDKGTIAAAIEGLSSWMDRWSTYTAATKSTLDAWSLMWPLAVDATNSSSDPNDSYDLNVVAKSVGDENEPMDLDTLNTPVGRLAEVFVAAWKKSESNPFTGISAARSMRDTMIQAQGRSGLIVKHRLIEYLPYFLSADPTWARQNLIAPLLLDDSSSIALWRAISRRTHFKEVLEIIGNAMLSKVTDRRLGRESRQRLAFSLVIESLHSFLDRRDPAVPNALIQQMLRSVEDELRAGAANAIQQFVSQISAQGERAASAVFTSSAKPFLENVWPQERSLVTPGVSSALADLPASSRQAFALAVETVERFLIPFDCWSLSDYGFFEDVPERPGLSIVEGDTEANALLKLLDLTIAATEGAVVPYDLGKALDHVRNTSPKSVKTNAFRRLSALLRR